MKKIAFYIFQCAALLALTASCNYREFRYSLVEYEDHASITYSWTLAVEHNEIPTDGMTIEFRNSAIGLQSYPSRTDSFCLDSFDKDHFNAFCYTPGENIYVKDKKFYAELNEDGTLKPVGQCYAGEENFTLRDPFETEAAVEANNTHQWTSPPYRNDSMKYVAYQYVPIRMHPQTRELRIIFKIDTEEGDSITDIQGVIDGLCKSRGENGDDYNTTSANLQFIHVVDPETGEDYWIAVIRVLGCSDEEPQTIDVEVTYNDGSTSSTQLDASDGLDGFDNELGGERVDVGFELTVKKEETGGFSATFTDWEDVNMGDYDLEADYTKTPLKTKK